jgi:hypothetical protein
VLCEHFVWKLELEYAIVQLMNKNKMATSIMGHRKIAERM